MKVNKEIHKKVFCFLFIAIVCLFSFSVGHSIKISQGLTPLESDYEINAELSQILYEIPGAILTRVAIIDSTISRDMIGNNQTPLYKFDIIYGKAIRGYPTGPFYKSVPLSQMSDYLPDLIANKCIYRSVNSLASDQAKKRIQNLKVSRFVGCPIFDSENTLLGAIFVSWDDSYHQLDENMIKQYEDIVRRSAKPIAYAIEWRLGPAVY